MNPQRVIDNRTPMSVGCVPMDDRHGREVMVIIMKMTYEVSPASEIRAVLFGTPIRVNDVTASEARSTMGAPPPNARWPSIRYPSDLVDEKPGTDVVLVGTAYPPPDRPATEQDVSVRIETRHRTLQKTIRVYGPRVWYEGTFGAVPGPPAVLGPTPLVYELAFGGMDESADREVVIDFRNPAGTGAAKNRSRLIGTPAPALEDPQQPLARSQPAPAGFGPIPAYWSPRKERAGTYDDVWRRERAPLRPADFDPRHNCCAVPELWSELPLAGDEPVEVLGATPEGAWRFQLPRYEPVIEVVGTSASMRPPLDTFLIDADSGRVELTFRASILLPRKTASLRGLRVRAANDLPEHIRMTS